MLSVQHHVESLGDRYLIDSQDLRSGERWSDALRAMIEDADVFQLFWSSSSMRSEHVRREWEVALGLGRENFVRPVYWEQPMPRDDENGLPPEALQELHFANLELQRFTETRIQAGRDVQFGESPLTMDGADLRYFPPLVVRSSWRTPAVFVLLLVGVIALVLYLVTR